MKIWRVTFTGADDQTSQQEMLELSKEFPSVEWGILFAGLPKRSPSMTWIESLPSQMNISAHLCKHFVKDALEGIFPELSKFGRIQLNLGKNVKKALGSEVLLKTSFDLEQDLIIGGNFSGVSEEDIEIVRKSPKFQILYDTSGGRGKISNWVNPFEGIPVGMAGGLNPDNLEEELEKIEKVVDDRHIWIDMESGVRTDDLFDLKKVRICLEISRKFLLQ